MKRNTMMIETLYAIKEALRLNMHLQLELSRAFFDYPKFKVNNAEMGVKNEEEHIFWDVNSCHFIDCSNPIFSVHIFQVLLFLLPV